VISVIMAAYNAERYIGQAIESVLSQTYPHFELIIVDDGSTDDTLNIVRSYAARDARIIVVQSEHGGVSKTRNIALKSAHHQWVASMDADDVSLPHRLERQMEASKKHPEVVVWGSYLTKVNDSGETLGEIQTGPTSVDEFNKLDRTKDYISLYNAVAMFRRDIALAVGGYNETISAAEDTELWDRMADHGPVVCIPEPLVLYRWHEQSLSTQKLDELQMVLGYPPARNRAKMRGECITLEQYRHSYHNRHPVLRFITFLGNKSAQHRKHARIRISQKRIVAAVLSIMLALLYNPNILIRFVRGNRLLVCSLLLQV
jgi:glycosyltransferase involved in cell wall biosynthesis